MTCQACGAADEICCPVTPDNTRACPRAFSGAGPERIRDGGRRPCASDGTCTLCGFVTEPCCVVGGDEVCSGPGAVCDMGACAECGANQQPCCSSPGPSCDEGTVCDEGRCTGAPPARQQLQCAALHLIHWAVLLAVPSVQWKHRCGSTARHVRRQHSAASDHV